MKSSRTHIKLGIGALICGGLIACTCGALDYDFSRMARDVMRVVGLRGVAAASQLAKTPLLKQIMVSAGQKLTIVRGTQVLMDLPPEEVTKELSWAGMMYQKDGWLAIRGQTLRMVIAEFNRHNKRQLRIGDPQTGELQIGGKFRVTDVDAFVAALKLTNDVTAAVAVKADGSGSGAGAGDIIILSGGRSQSPVSAGYPNLPPADVARRAAQ